MSATDRVRAYLEPFVDLPDHSLDRVYLGTGEIADLSLADLREVLSLADAYESVST